MRLTHTEMINASRETVFALLSDPDKQLLWRDGLVAIEVLATSPATAGVGTQTVETFHKGRKKAEYRISSEVTALDAPDAYATRISNDDFFGEITYLLEPVGGATRLVSIADMTYPGNVVAQFFGQMAVHHNRADMKKLIRLAETA